MASDMTAGVWARQARSLTRTSWVVASVTVAGLVGLGHAGGLSAADPSEAPTVSKPIPIVIPSLREFSRMQSSTRVAAATVPHRDDAPADSLAFPAVPPSRLAVPSAAPIRKRPVDSQASQRPTDGWNAAAPRGLPTAQERSHVASASTSDLENDLIAAEVRGMLLEYLRAFRSRDAAAVAACWSESADNRSLDSGEETHGREQVEQVFQTLFEEDASAEIDLDIQEIRPLGGDVAVVDGISQLSFSTGDATASRFSAIVMKKDGRWMLESVREAATELPESSRGYAIRRVGEFAGRWESVSGRQDVSTHAFWTAGGGFLVRSHTMQGEAGDREITEIIGWDPVRQGIRSWSFTSDGGFAEGSWTLDDDHFDVLLDGTTAEGELVTGRMTITSLGPDDLRTDMEGTAIAELLPPTGDMVRTAR